MATTFFNLVQDIVHFGSLAGIVAVFLLIVAGIARPSLFAPLMHSFSQRRYITVLGMFLCLLGATIFIATDTTSKDYQQHLDKPTIQQAGTFKERPETSQPAVEEAQTTDDANQSRPAAVQGAQTPSQQGTSSTSIDLDDHQGNQDVQGRQNESASNAHPQEKCDNTINVELLNKRLCIL